MFCQNCGNEVGEGLHYCGSCGAPVYQEKTRQVRGPQPQGGGFEAPRDEKRGLRILVIALIFVLLAIGAFAATILYLMRGPAPAAETAGAAPGPSGTAPEPAPVPEPEPIPEPEPEPAGELTDDEIASLARDAGNHHLYWFYSCGYVEDRPAFLEGGGYEKGGKTYYKTTYPGVSSVQDLRDLTGSYYTSEVTDRYMSENAGQWLDEDGALYWSYGGGVGDPLILHVYLVIQRVDEARTHVVFLAEPDSRSVPFDVMTSDCVLEDGRWVFDGDVTNAPYGTEYSVIPEQDAIDMVRQWNRSVKGRMSEYDTLDRMLKYDPGYWYAGYDVYLLQCALIEMNYDNLEATGIYDLNTAAAVGRFQKRHGLEETSVVDDPTGAEVVTALAVWRKKH